MQAGRFLVFAAHPDDADICFGGTAVRLIRAGHVVKFVSMTNGDCGHYEMAGAVLAERRRREAEASRAVAGLAEYEICDIRDGQLELTVENRSRIVRIIRNFAPDVVLTHRTCDYHVDHRTTAQLVMDAAYLIRVPLFCPDTPIPEKSPIFAHMYDPFVDPRPFRPDVMVPIDQVLDEKCRMIDCHVSQIYEWLAWERHLEVDLKNWTWEQRKEYILKNWLDRNINAADLGRERLIADLGEAGRQVRYAEAFEWSPYGGRISGDEAALRELLTAQ